MEDKKTYETQQTQNAYDEYHQINNKYVYDVAIVELNAFHQQLMSIKGDLAAISTEVTNALNNFSSQIKEVKAEIAQAIENTAVEAFTEQLKKTETLLEEVKNLDTSYIDAQNELKKLEFERLKAEQKITSKKLELLQAGISLEVDEVVETPKKQGLSRFRIFKSKK